MKKTSLSENQMKTLIAAVAKDLTDAKLYSTYLDELDEYLKNKYPNVISFSLTFWSNALQVFHAAMTKCLMRVYDQNKNCVGLKLLLKRINDNIALFSDHTFKNRMQENPHINNLMQNRPSLLDFKLQLETDIQYVDHTKNEYVKKLKVIRDKNGFHKDEKVIYKERPDLDTIKISHEDIKKLIDDGLKILNYYSYQFDANRYSSYMIGYGDHKKIFQIMQEHHEILQLGRANQAQSTII